MRIFVVVAIGLLTGCLAACEPTASPISRIPRPTAPTPPSTTDPAPSPGPLQTFRRTIIGTVRGANGGPLGGVEIDGWLGGRPNAEPVAVTAADGTFRIEGTVYETLSFRKIGYEHRGWNIPRRLIPEASLSIAETLQPYLLMAAGERFSSVLTADDVSYPDAHSHPWDTISGCVHCKLIHVAGADAGATLKLSWSGSMPLTLWAGTTGGYWGHDVYAFAPGESEIVVSTEWEVNAVLIGINPLSVASRPLTEPVTFTLSVEKR